VINWTTFLPAALDWKASNFHYSFSFYFWTVWNEKKLWEMLGRVEVRQPCHYNSFWMMTRDGNELPNSISLNGTLFNYDVIIIIFVWSKRRFQFWQIFSLLRIHPEMLWRCCVATYFGIKVIKFSSFLLPLLTNCDEICRFQHFLMRKLSYCCFANGPNLCFFEKGSGGIAMFCHDYANNSIFIGKMKSTRSKSLNNFSCL
jgi:hypothetical protein